ncbi:transporter substrate-binding domain-containing protein [Halovulum dunhuangense]|uniref:Transporter substrate-binding domain-containing protein n=1 Tax=Halovulum dunhuangense TaxID=1505036 RepID=A0A849L0Y5_9RHOB|nr:transporter substrate-binding domain-containing protein [Halovulum dunhuangense]NNU79924.1 transporter substrate-binding domain-containing protein [Halovulum dunhuangense]
MSAEPSLWRDLGAVGAILGLFALIGLAPPDSSLSEIRREGVLRACVPSSYGVLVTPDPDAPGFETEILQAVADRLGVRLALNLNEAIGRDFNPRAWRLTRAQCQIIAGGVIASDTTRTFIDTTPPHLETGWVVLAPGAVPASLRGQKVGVHVGVSGRDRLALSQALRTAGAGVVRMDGAGDLADALATGRVGAGVVDAMIGMELAQVHGLQIAWLQGPEARDPVAFGLWKGDLTLKRRVVDILDELERDGTMARLAARYGIRSIEARFADAGGGGA